MATDPKRRQKSLAKKAAKRKAKKAATTAGAFRTPRLADFPLHECLVPAELFNTGIGTVLVSRRLTQGAIAWCGFLMDPWCLGVKNALAQITSEARYDDHVDDVTTREPLEEVEPAYAKKLILDAIAYARDLGFEPHPDYREAARILEGIDVATCKEVFSFGHAGKPTFFAGPNETPSRCRQILRTLRTLHARLGPDGFYFTVHGRSKAEFEEIGFPGIDVESLGRESALPWGSADDDPVDDCPPGNPRESFPCSRGGGSHHKMGT